MNRKILTSILDNFQNKKIIVIGDVMIDEYIWGDVHRISPEAPVPVVEMNDVSIRLGGAANVAYNIASLGATPILIGVIGDDEGAEMIGHSAIEAGISTDYFVQDHTRPTTRKTRVIAHQQQVVRIDRESTTPISDETAQKILTIIDQQLPQADAILMQDYNKGLLTDSLISEVIKRANCLITVDPKFENFFAYQGVTVFKPNLREAEVMLGMKIRNTTDVQNMGKMLLERLQCEMVLLTQGPDGMTLFEDQNNITYIPTVAREVYDVSGAGDTVISTVTLALTAGATPIRAAVLANHAAGVVVGKVGSVPITFSELKNCFMEGDPNVD